MNTYFNYVSLSETECFKIIKFEWKDNQYLLLPAFIYMWYIYIYISVANFSFVSWNNIALIHLYALLQFDFHSKLCRRMHISTCMVLLFTFTVLHIEFLCYSSINYFFEFVNGFCFISSCVCVCECVILSWLLMFFMYIVFIVIYVLPIVM